MNQIATSLTLPQELDTQIRKLAKKRGQTKTGYIREALQNYIYRQEIADIEEELRMKARAMGIRTEDDVVKLIHDFRREQRQQIKK